jgi:hypothetical protein
MKADRSPDPSPNPAAPKKVKTTAQSFSAADFPELRSFLRGYLHQDMKDEYGSPEEAAREFCSDASGEERAAVADQWARFVNQTHGMPLDQVNRILTGPLGSSYALTAEDLAGISALFAQSARKGKK